MSVRATRVVVAAVRTLVVVVIAATVVTATLATSSWHLALIVVALVVPGVVAWSRPTPAALAAWSAIGWATAFASAFTARMNDASPPPTLAVAFALVMIGAPLAAFAIATARTSYARDPAPRVRRVRAMLRVVVVSAIVVGGLAALPGERVFDDSQDCLAEVFAFTTERHPSCTPSYDRLVETRAAGGRPIALFLVLVLAPLPLAYADPRRRGGGFWLGWMTFAIGGGACTWFMLTFHIDLFSSTITLWPRDAVAVALEVLVAQIAIVLPLVVLGARDARVPIARALRRADSVAANG